MTDKRSAARAHGRFRPMTASREPMASRPMARWPDGRWPIAMRRVSAGTAALSAPTWHGPREPALDAEAMEEGKELPGFRGGGPQGWMAGGRSDVEGPGLARATEEATEDGDAVVQAGLHGRAEDPGRDAVRGEGADQLEAGIWRWHRWRRRQRWRRRRSWPGRFDAAGEIGLGSRNQDGHGDGMAPIEIHQQVEVPQQERRARQDRDLHAEDLPGSTGQPLQQAASPPLRRLGRRVGIRLRAEDQGRRERRDLLEER